MFPGHAKLNGEACSSLRRCGVITLAPARIFIDFCDRILQNAIYNFGVSISATFPVATVFSPAWSICGGANARLLATGAMRTPKACVKPAKTCARRAKICVKHATFPGFWARKSHLQPSL